MIKIGKLPISGIPRIAISLRDRTPLSSLRYLRGHVDIVELRVDQFSSYDTKYVLNEAKKIKYFPIIATIRSYKEGGNWKEPEAQRLELFKALIPHVDAVDIELSSKDILKEVIRSAHLKKKLVIVSYHNFQEMPALTKLNQIVKQAKALKADIVKIAALSLSKKDTQLLGNFTALNQHKNLITIAMGTQGAVSRILFPALGSLVTYTFLDQPSAPGQIDFRTTATFLKKLCPGS